MAVVIPFRAMRFTPAAGNPEKLICPPYDIISEEQRKAFLRENEHNIIRLELPAEGADPYAAAAEIQKKWLDEGILSLDEKRCVYVYEIEFTDGGEQKTVGGIICRVKLEEFSKGIILPHEETLTKAKEDRLKLMKATGSNFSQIYSLYNDPEGETAESVDSWTASHEPLQTVRDTEGLIHRLWLIDDEAICEAITGQFIDRKLYIADGHHRYETAINYRNFLREQSLAVPGDDCDYIMMMLVDMNHKGLTVFPTHRIVRGLEGFDPEKLIKGCSDDFDVQLNVPRSMVKGLLDFAYAGRKTAFALYYRGADSKVKACITTYKDKLVPEALLSGSEAVRGLDVSVLHSMVLERAMGIDKQNMANQKNLTYTRSEAEAYNAVESGEADCAFIINPTRVEEIRDVAAAGEKMPQKSTYFYPKLITGLVMNKITKD